MNPFEGGKIALVESARNVACAGAKPLAFTNCLNFGNPMDPEKFYQLKKCVEGITEAAKILSTPCTGGNVSLYNESPVSEIYPTPTIAIVGVLEDIDNRVPSYFQSEGDVVCLLGETLNEIGGSHYLMIEHKTKKGPVPALNLEAEKKLQDFLVSGAKDKLFASAHDLSEGGLALGLAECTFGNNIGADIDLISVANEKVRTDALLFGESHSRVIVSVKKENESKFLTVAKAAGVPAVKIGVCGGDKLKINNYISLSIEQMKTIYEEAIPSRV